MYQSGNKHKHYEIQVTNIFMDVSIRKQSIKMMKILFLTQKSVKITKARAFTQKHDHFVLHHFFAKTVARNEAHKNQRIQGKNKKLSKSRRGMRFWGIYFETPKSCYSQVSQKSTNFGHF